MNEIKRLVADLESDNITRQTVGAEGLARLGEGARPAIVEILRALRSLDPTVYEWCVSALEEIGPPLPDQIDQIAEFARDDSEEAAYWAITLLGRAGEQSRVAVPILVEVLRNSSRFSLAVREKSAWALGKIGAIGDSAIAALREAASSQTPRLSRLATRALDSTPGDR